MELSHEWFVGAAKSFGLFWLIGLSICITAYAFWPSLGGRFDKAAKSILDDEEGPARHVGPEPVYGGGPCCCGAAACVPIIDTPRSAREDTPCR